LPFHLDILNWRLMGGLIAGLGALGLAAMPLEAKPEHERPPYPATPERQVIDHYFGENVVDPFRWLEDGDSQETKAWMDAQNALTRKVLDGLDARGSLRARLLELMQAPRQDPPSHRGKHYFFRRQDGQLPQSVLMVAQSPAGPARTLIDPNPLSADHTVSLDWWDASPKGTTVAYGVSQSGNEQSVLHLVDVATGKTLNETIVGCRYTSIAWLSDEQSFYYTRFPGAGANGQDKQRIYYHRLGTDPVTDPVVFEPVGGAELIMWVQTSKDDRYVLVTVNQGSNTKTELYLADRHVEEGKHFEPIVQGFKAYFVADMHEGHLYVRTDEDAPRGKIMVANLADAAHARWQVVVPEAADTLQSAFVAGGHLVGEYLHDAVSQVRLFGLDGHDAGTIAFPGLGTVNGLGGNEDDAELFFSYTSYLQPATVYRYDMLAQQREVVFKPELNIELDRYEERQVWFRSKDGTRVPMVLVHRKGLALDGQNPTLLTAYGGFDISVTPNFSAIDMTWIERGGVLAVPNIRGGGEFGAAWHEGGMRERKQNVFDDFYAAAEWLIAEHITSSEHLAIQGGSNGGLLMGAALTQRPELFKAVLCAVPLLDMLRFHRFLIARYWVPEYGSSEDEAGYTYLKAYSPYQHVKPGTHYPATLIVTGVSDTRVDPLHARKMAALLQRDQGGTAPIYLYVESKAGHGAGKPLTKRVETAADTLGFLAWQLGLDQTKERP
jgi:prolyl oligopeptidase